MSRKPPETAYTKIINYLPTNKAKKNSRPSYVTTGIRTTDLYQRPTNLHYRNEQIELSK